MLQIAFEIPPDPWDVGEVLALAVAHRKAGENAEDFRIALRPQCCIAKAEFAGIEGCVAHGHGGDVVVEQGVFEAFRHIQPGVLQQRHEVVGGGTAHRILEIDDPDVARRRTAVEDDQVGRMIIAQQPGFGLFQDAGKNALPFGREFRASRIGRRLP